jgi:Cdc6-like AAA superfamily ATPase
METETIKADAEMVASAFASSLGGIEPDHRIVVRPDGPFLAFEFCEPHARFFDSLLEALSAVPDDNIFRDRAAIQKRPKRPANILASVETKMLQREIAECLTVDRFTFGADFFSRYTPSVNNLESQVVAKANFLVYGRRGSGKSSLLAFAMHSLQQRNLPIAWVSLQTYAGRKDPAVVSSVLAEILHHLGEDHDLPELSRLATDLEAVADEKDDVVRRKIERVLPRVRAGLGRVATPARPLTVFLDDLHVLDVSVQPELLHRLYSAFRGNNCYLKVSGIEQLTRPWDSQERVGMEPPHDAQILKLDYNLTMPDRSKEHIHSILDAHAKYCGLPGIRALCDDAVISRLVLVAAAVPRDALSLFLHAISRSEVKREKGVSILSVHAAASEAIEEKSKDISKDFAEGAEDLEFMLARIRDFCVSAERKNSFLVRIRTGDLGYEVIQKLIALRFIHVLHEGLTPHRAGERFVALMLDFGFYIGQRAARSVELFPKEPKPLVAKDLRKLPVFEP